MIGNEGLLGGRLAKFEVARFFPFGKNDGKGSLIAYTLANLL